MKKRKLSGLLQVFIATLGLLIIGAGELVLWRLSGYAPLLGLSLIQLLGGTVNLVLLLPLGRQRELAVPDPEAKFWKKLLVGTGNLLRRIGNFWQAKLAVIMTIPLLAALLGGNWIAWTNVAVKCDPSVLAYYLPVVLAVLFVLSVVLEKWCGVIAADEEAGPRAAAIAANVRDILVLGRIGQVLCLLTMVLSLIGLYDAQKILQILLLILFVFESVMLLLSIAIRLIRKELTTAPALPLSVKAIGASGVLSYLEENTGITMRSLWSIKLVRELIPSVMLFVLVLTWLATGLVLVEANEEGALFRLGKLQEDTLKPGLHMTLPWPFDKVEIHDTRSIRTVVVGYVPNGTTDNTWTEGHGTEEYRLLLGGGNEMVSINLQVHYRVSDLNRYLSGSASADSLLSAAAYEIVTARTIVTDIDTLLAADRTVFSETFRQELEQRIAKYNVGIEITEVVLESIHPPVEVADVYQRVISAGIQAEQLVIEAERQAIAEVSAAKQQAFSEVSIASTTRHQKIAAAEGAVAEFMAGVAAYNGYPEAYVYYKYMNAMTQAYQKGVLIIVGDGVDSGGLVIGDLSRPIPEDPYFIEEEVEEEYYQ